MKIEREGYTFFIKLTDTLRAEINCEKKGKELKVTRSYTPEEYRGRGIATSIMKEVIKYARQEKLTIIPDCEFAKNYCMKNKC
ncbi:MAG TPA: GNAT family N-acetyltransferase [Candidatus Nanoarchaeia archaeon]|nr:GNAT family N-acetyltransferase [Candidatus Nanoarchaeia archaeon]